MTEQTPPRAVIPSAAILAIVGPLQRADLPDLYARAHVLLAARAVATLHCELTDVRADAVAIEALARLALLARRQGCEMRLGGISAQLCELIRFVGLAEVLRTA